MRKVIEEKKTQIGSEQFARVLQRLILQMIDMFWVEHLEAMDYMRGSVQLRAYGQRDPLVEYKKEGLRMFQTMEDSAKEEILKLIPNIGGQVGTVPTEKLQEVREQPQVRFARIARR